MKKLLPFLKPYRREVILGPAFKLTEAILELILPLLMARIIDVAIPSGDQSQVVRLGLLILLLAAAGMGCAFICQYYSSIASQGVGTDIRNALFSRILSFGPAEIEHFGAQSLVNRLGGDVNQVQLAVAMLIRLVVRAPFLSIGGLIMAMLIDLRLSLIFMIVIPLFVVVLYLVMTHSIPFYRGIQAKLDSLSRVLRENLSGIRVIRAYARADTEKERFAAANETMTETILKVGRIAVLLNPATTLILNAGAIAVLYFGAERIQVQGMSRGEIIAFLNYLAQILVAMIVVANLVVLYTRAFASAQRIESVLATEPTMKENMDANEPADEAASVTEQSLETPALEFENIRFAYSAAADPVFDLISLRIRAGERIGLIGATGSGKTTLARLALRLYDVNAGAVRVFGKDVRSLSFNELRSQIGLAPQKAVLMTGSLADNLRMGNPDVTDAMLQEHLQVAAADDFTAELPQGLAAPVSRGGTNFSGGQRQRLAITRALSADPRILILDDCFSALDYLTEAKLRSRLNTLTPQKTLIFISQRISSIRTCDRIIVLDDGTIVGFDTHKALLSSCSVYREICRTQSPDEVMDHAL